MAWYMFASNRRLLCVFTRLWLTRVCLFVKAYYIHPTKTVDGLFDKIDTRCLKLCTFYG